MSIISNDRVLRKLSYMQMEKEQIDKAWRFRNARDVVSNDIANRIREKDLVNGLAEAETILLNYENVDEKLYYTLINSIFLTSDLARVVLKTSTNKGFSFLLLALRNPNLKLDAVQKAFAVKEAMYRKGTTFWKEKEDNIVPGVDDSTIYIDMNRYYVPIGACFEGDYNAYTVTSVATSEAYGVFPYDIRYYILKNASWSEEEKKSLIYGFFENDTEYDKVLKQWELGVVNSAKSELINIDNMYDFSLESLEKIENKDIALTLWKDIDFCREMHELRPLQREKSKILEKNKTTK